MGGIQLNWLKSPCGVNKWGHILVFLQDKCEVSRRKSETILDKCYKENCETQSIGNPLSFSSFYFSETELSQLSSELPHSPAPLFSSVFFFFSSIFFIPFHVWLKQTDKELLLKSPRSLIANAFRKLKKFCIPPL